jgi:hypothetical protein
MSQPEPIPYASNSRNAIDASQLKTLAICHYVCGGLEIAFGSIFIFHIVMGVAIARGVFPVATGNSPPPPNWIGYIFAAMGGCAVFFGWSVGILTILSGRAMARRRRRIFSLVMAGVSCAWFPFGTVLGVFTFIVLLRTSVQAMYESGAGSGST